MQISDPVRTLVDILQDFSGGKMTDTELFGAILQHAHDTSRVDAVAQLSFHGNYLTRLLGTIRRQEAGSEHGGKLEEEFSRGVHEFHTKISVLTEDADPELRGVIEKHYLAVSHDALRHLVDLAADFAWLKNWELAYGEALKAEGLEQPEAEQSDSPGA